MADRVAVFNHGRIEQLATPRELYMRPAHRLRRALSSAAPTWSKATLAQRLSGSPAAVRRCAPSRSRCFPLTQPAPAGHDERRGHGARRAVPRREQSLAGALDEGEVFGASLANPRRTRRHRCGRSACACAWQREHALPWPRGPAHERERVGAAASRRARWRTFSTGARCCYLALLLVPPLLWFGTVYLGSLLALLLQSFYAIDEFTAKIVHEPTLATYKQLVTQPANIDIIVRTLLMAVAVTIACAIIAFPIANYMARYAHRRASRRSSMSA